MQGQIEHVNDYVVIIFIHYIFVSGTWSYVKR